MALFTRGYISVTSQHLVVFHLYCLHLLHGFLQFLTQSIIQRPGDTFYARHYDQVRNSVGNVRFQQLPNAYRRFAADILTHAANHIKEDICSTFHQSYIYHTILYSYLSNVTPDHGNEKRFRSHSFYESLFDPIFPCSTH